jgi:ketosteroid isomerase-like protein
MRPVVENSEIRQHLDSLAEALRAKDIDTLMTHYASDVVTYDLRPPHEIFDRDRYRQNFAAWFGSVKGDIGYLLQDVRTAASGDVGFCHHVAHVTSTRTTGDKSDYWVRVSSGLRKVDGRWLIVHEHISMPILMETMKAQPSLAA